MGRCHEYTKEQWKLYYADEIKEDERLKMSLHLGICNQCLDCYMECVEENLTPAPLQIKTNVMTTIQRPLNVKQIMFAYITAASIALFFYSSGILDRTINDMPKRMSQSLSKITTITDNVTQTTNNFIWRDINEPKK